MISANALYAFDKVNEAGEFVLGNSQGETLTFQIMGNASAITLSLYGRVDFLSNEWVPLNCVNLTTLDISTTVTAKGIYMTPVEGLANIKFVLGSVSGGEVSVFCRLTKGD